MLCAQRRRCASGSRRPSLCTAAGNGTGDVYIFSTASGERSGSASQSKLSGGVRSCAISEDCRHVLAAIGNGFLFRWAGGRAGAASASGLGGQGRPRRGRLADPGRPRLPLRRRRFEYGSPAEEEQEEQEDNDDAAGARDQGSEEQGSEEGSEGEGMQQ